MKKIIINYTELVNKPVKDLTEKDLKTFYQYLKWNVFRKFYFKDLPDPRKVEFTWNSGLKRAIARCYNRRTHAKTPELLKKVKNAGKIEFQHKYYINYPKDFLSVMAHEMIHLFTYDSHGYGYLTVVNKINKYLGFEFIYFTPQPEAAYHAYMNALTNNKKENEVKNGERKNP
jgi:hypothetical protein